MRTLRWLRDDFRDVPATMVLGATWVILFLAMLADQLAHGEGLSPLVLISGLHNGHRFGALTLRDLFAGESWRVLTSTFIHFGLIHIGLNLYALYQVGGLVEEWYGTGPFLAIYVLTGGVGNGLSGLVRRALGSNESVLSGGGSTVIMGLVALCAVASWGARTDFGKTLRNQMLFFLALTAALGVGLQLAGLPAIDNWGHAGGAFVGAGIGLGNRVLLRRPRKAIAHGVGWISVLTIVTCAAAQVKDAESEGALRKQRAAEALQRYQADERLLFRLDEVRQVYRAVAVSRAIRRGSIVREVPRRDPQPMASPPKTTAKSQSDRKPGKATQGTNPTVVLQLEPEWEFYLTVVNASFRSLASMGAELEARAGSSDYRKVRQIVARSLNEPPTLEELHEFDQRIAALENRLRQDRDAARAQALGRPNAVLLE